jgi:hypothetical protein
MAYTQKYLENNRKTINEKRRAKYSSEARKEEYITKREEILKRGKEDRALCPMCGLDFRRLYIPKHIATRHKCKLVEDLNETTMRPPAT